jgi:hypothetical protein
MMNTAFYRITAIFLLASLWPLQANAIDVRPVCPAKNSKNYFFAKNTFHLNSARRDQFVNRWYSKHLRAMSETSLSCGKDVESETYRFTWLRTFHHPIAVRITRIDGQGRLIAVELNGYGGYGPGTVIKRIEKKLTPEQWQTLLAVVDSAKFWELPTDDISGGRGFDGAEWVVEARRGRAYHLVSRWSPESGDYHKLALHFLLLAGIVTPPDEMY